MTTPMSDVYLIPQQSTFEIQEFTYIYVIMPDRTVRIRSFEPLGRYKGHYIANGLDDSTRIVYSGIQGIKEGSKINYRDIAPEWADKITETESRD